MCFLCAFIQWCLYLSLVAHHGCLSEVFFRRAKWFVLVTPFLPYLLHVFLAMIYSWDLLKCCRYIDVIGDDYCCHILHHLELSMAVVTSTPAYQTHLFHSRNRVFDLQTITFLELLQCLSLNCEEWSRYQDYLTQWQIGNFLLHKFCHIGFFCQEMSSTKINFSVETSSGSLL